MKMKNDKSVNDIPAIYIKSAIACKPFMKEILSLYRTILETGIIPTEWGHSKLVALWKGSSKGNIENPEAYRALPIGASLCKILVVIIINRISSWYEKQILDQQDLGQAEVQHMVYTELSGYSKSPRKWGNLYMPYL